jgi:glycosyltransferase involved in cell wall biosynthesis
VKLVFTGLQHPQDPNPITEMGRRAVALAQELGVKDRQVFFIEGWIPAEDLDDYLLEADVGVVAHLATVETTFAVRTRFWDYLHGGLPVIGSEGDWAAELVRAQGLGCAVAVGDAEGWAGAIEALSDYEARRRCSAAVRRVARTMTWDRVVEPLVGLLAGGLVARPRPAALAPKRPPSKLVGGARGNWHKFRASVASDGLPTALQKSYRKIFVS